MKYVQPASMTWWVSVAPLLGGVLLALADSFPVMEPAAKFVHSLAGYDVTAARLIQLGLLGIGLTARTGADPK